MTAMLISSFTTVGLFMWCRHANTRTNEIRMIKRIHELMSYVTLRAFSIIAQGQVHLFVALQVCVRSNPDESNFSYLHWRRQTRSAGLLRQKIKQSATAANTVVSTLSIMASHNNKNIKIRVYFRYGTSIHMYISYKKKVMGAISGNQRIKIITVNFLNLIAVSEQFIKVKFTIRKFTKVCLKHCHTLASSFY